MALTMHKGFTHIASWDTRVGTEGFAVYVHGMEGNREKVRNFFFSNSSDYGSFILDLVAYTLKQED